MANVAERKLLTADWKYLDIGDRQTLTAIFDRVKNAPCKIIQPKNLQLSSTKVQQLRHSAAVLQKVFSRLNF